MKNIATRRYLAHANAKGMLCFVGAFVLLSTPHNGALAQGGMGGGMGRGGAQGAGPGGGPPPGGRPGRGGPPRPMKPVKRTALDKPVAGMFRNADGDKDGVVTLEELRATINARRDTLVSARFQRIDSNRDGALSLPEFLSWQQQMGSASLYEAQPIILNGGPIPENIMPDLDNDMVDQALRLLIEPLSANLIANANSNYDRGLSLDELLVFERARFDAADTDGDGELSMMELRDLEPDNADRGPGGPRRPGGPAALHPPCSAGAQC